MKRNGYVTSALSGPQNRRIGYITRAFSGPQKGWIGYITPASGSAIERDIFRRGYITPGFLGVLTACSRQQGRRATGCQSRNPGSPTV
jgi:hypothetical protein